jgi:hypothetical protein
VRDIVAELWSFTADFATFSHFFQPPEVLWVSLPAFPASYGLLSCRNQKPSFIANAFPGRQAVRPGELD